MIKILCWLILTLLSATGLGAWFLQQQYDARSADFRILYREITVKVSQHDAIIPLLPSGQNAAEVQQILPQIVQWRRYDSLEPRRTIVAQSPARYWLNLPGISLLIDLNILLNSLNEKKTFKHLAIRWDGTTLFEDGTASTNTWWRWEKTVVSPTQPLLISAGDNPQWHQLPWWLILSPALFWAVIIYLVNQYRTNKRRRDIADLRTRYGELTRLNTMGELAAGIVHELNQPLTAIMSYNQAAVRLIKKNDPVKIPELLEASVLQIKRIDALLSQFRLKLTSKRAEYQPVDLPSLWLRVCELLDNEIRAGKVRISSHFPSDLPALPAPPLWVEQILHNIVSNAIQAQSTNVPGSAWIHLQAVRVNNGIALTLTDGGPGLSSEALEQVFIPFYTTRTDGVGLGMALTDTLVQRLNGKIEASNITGQGACFRLWFPLRNEEK